MDWTNDTSLALIEEYRKHPELWHTRHNHYYSKTNKQKAWEAIADYLQVEVNEVRQKMNSLMGSFRRERSKMRRGEGRYALGNLESGWFAFKKMLFLLDRRKELSSDKVYLEELQTEPDENDDDDDDDDDLNLDSDSNHLLEEELNEASYEPSSRTRKLPNPLELPRRKKTKFRHCSATVIDDLSLFPDEDECAIYGQYVAKKLMKMSCRTRALVQRSINNILFEADLGKYDDMPSPFDNNKQTFLDAQSDGVDLFAEQLALTSEVTDDAIADT